MKVTNVDRLTRKIAALPNATREQLQKALRVSATAIVKDMKAMAPVRSGDLRNSIGFTFGKYAAENSNVRGVTASGGGHELSVTIHAGDAKAFYAAFVEFGTAPHSVARGGGSKHGQRLARQGFGRMHPGAAPQPFFFPAYRLNKKSAKARIARAVTAAAKATAKGGK